MRQNISHRQMIRKRMWSDLLYVREIVSTKVRSLYSAGRCMAL